MASLKDVQRRFVVRIEDGTIRDHWNVVDAMGLMSQLGAV